MDEEDDIFSRGRAFVKQAESLLLLEDTGHSLPVAQGLALLYIYEGTLGDGAKALNYHARFQAMYFRLFEYQLPPISMENFARSSRDIRMERGMAWILWGFYIFDRLVRRADQVQISLLSLSQEDHARFLPPLCDTETEQGKVLADKKGISRPSLMRMQQVTGGSHTLFLLLRRGC
jgi:hypothetical protein